MSYAVRNTIILLVTLALFIGGAFIYIRYFQLAELERLESSLAEKQTDFNEKRATSNAFPELNQRYQRALTIIENYDKSLFSSPDPDDVYDYINYVANSNVNSRVFFDYVFVDSVNQDQYGILNSSINGYGQYDRVINFVNKIENSQLLNKISEISITPVRNPSEEGNELNEVTFTFNLQSYYERISIQSEVELTDRLTLDESISTYNPFFPLIQSTIPPNVDNLIDIERSRLIGMTGNRIFIVDQSGNITTLRKGDKVYLGQLASIDLNDKSAIFNLNKGGINETVTLEIER